MEEEDSVSTLPWSWVIETLAKSQLLDTTLLYELILKAPPLLGDSGKKAREAIALRCLEGLFGLPSASSEKEIAPDWSKFGFDPAESCEAALQRIISEASGSNGTSDELKCAVQSFVKHKKASLPRSTLELLKDEILDDTRPLAASLKEVSGLAVPDQCVLNIPFDGGDPTSPPLRSDEDDHGDKTMLAEEIGCSPKSGINDQLLQAYFPNENLLACRDGLSSHRTDNHVQEIEAPSHDIGKECPTGKKRNLDKESGMQSKHQHSVPIGSNQMCNRTEDGQYHELITENDEWPPGKKPKQDKEYCMQSKHQHSVPFGGNRMCNGVEDGQYHEVITENEIHDSKSHGKDVDEQSKRYVENYDQQQISPSNGDHCCEDTGVFMKNPIFLSSQCLTSGDSLDMTETEPNLCMKCNRDGQLISCSASSCPLLFHESCLGCSVSCDDQGNFYCPFCAYSRAISEYIRAKKKVSLARKELSLFIGGRTGDQPEHDDDTSSGDNVNQGKHKNVDKTAEVKEFAKALTQIAKPHQSLKGKQLELSHSSAYMDVNGFVMTTREHHSFKDRQGAEVFIQFSRDPSRIWNQGQVDHGCDDVQSFGDNNELKTHGKITRCKITELHGDASSESISDSDGPLQDKRNDGVSSLPFPRPLSAIPNIPPRRRTKVRWTAEEEAMLKKGVEVFVHADGQTIPWKNILEYGDSVFQKGRTAVDLKDKWRNMTRGTSPKVK